MCNISPCRVIHDSLIRLTSHLHIYTNLSVTILLMKGTIAYERNKVILHDNTTLLKYSVSSNTKKFVGIKKYV